MSTIPSTFSSPSAIRAHAVSREDGNGKRWFDKATMRWWACRLLRGVIKGADGRWYFIRSEDPGASIGRPQRVYRVAAYSAAANRVETVGSVEGYFTPEQARAEMNRLAQPAAP